MSGILLGIGSILAGYIAMAVAVGVMNIVLGKTWPGAAEATTAGQSPPTGYIVANLLLGTALAGAASIVTALIAPEPQITWVWWFALLVLVLGVGYAFKQRGGPQPDWYLFSLPILGALAIWFVGRWYLG